MIRDLLTGPEIAPLPTHFVGLCDECRTVKSFTSARDRDLWQRNHAHQSDPA